MKKIVNLNQYKDNAKNEEQKLENIIQYLQIKLLEELYYRTDVEIKNLHAKLEKSPGMNFIMEIGGEKNLNTYFYKLYIDKLFEEAIMSDRNDEEIRDTIYDIRSDILNNLIVTYLPSKSYLIDNVKFNKRFFKECSVDQLFLSDKLEIINFFKYRNEVNEFSSMNSDRKITVKRNAEECQEIKDDVLGKLEFIEEKQMYLCDYCGDYNNFTIKIMINDKKEAEDNISFIKKIVERLNQPKKQDNDSDCIVDSSSEEFRENISQLENFKDKMADISSNPLNLTTVHIWPDKEVYLVYSQMVNDEENKGIEIGVFTPDC